MTVYKFRELGLPAIWKGLKAGQYDPYRLRNAWRESVLVIEGDPNGFRQLAVHFLVVAGASNEGYHVHLQSLAKGAGGWAFESGVEVSIGLIGRRGNRPPPEWFEHEASPVVNSDVRPLDSGSVLSVANLEEEGITIDGNEVALVSLAKHCLDLAEPGTPPDTELSYRPNVQLTGDSMPLNARRI